MCVTLTSAAEEQAALRTQWALKMLVSIPALLSTVFNHRATVDDETGLCGLIIAIRKCVLPFGERLSVVVLLYSCSVQTGQSFLFCSNLRKRKK